MGILRQVKRQNFTTVSNVFIEDNDLTFKAKGILLWLLSKPDGWELKEYAVANAGPDGKSSVSSGVDELIDAGYVKRSKVQNARGHWIWETQVSEIPIFVEQNFRFPDSAKPDLGNPDFGKAAPIVKTDLTNTDLTNTDLDFSPEKPARKPDEVFEAVAEVCGIDWHELTPSSRSVLGKSVKDLKLVGATPEEILNRALIYKQRFGVALTPTALAKHWPSLHVGLSDVSQSQAALLAAARK